MIWRSSEDQTCKTNMVASLRILQRLNLSQKKGENVTRTITKKTLMELVKTSMAILTAMVISATQISTMKTSWAMKLTLLLQVVTSKKETSTVKSVHAAKKVAVER